MHIQTIRGNIYSYLRRTNEIVGGVADESDYTWRFNPLNQFNTMSEIEMFIIGITEQCNLRCTYCCYSGDYVNNRIHGSHTLTGRDIDVIYDFIQQIAGNRRLRIAFYGGEPLLQYQLIQYAIIRGRERWGNNVDFSISTNGVLLNNEKIEWLSINSVELAISIDGTKVFHNKHRVDIMGNGSYERVYSALSHIKETYPEYIPCVLLQMTLVAFSDIIQIAREWNSDGLLKSFVLSNIHGLSPNFINGVKTVDYEETKQLYLHILDAYEKHQDWVVLKIFLDECLAYWKDRPIIDARQSVPMATCMPINSKIYIDSQMQIGICEKVADKYRIGNVKNDNLILDIQPVFVEDVIGKTTEKYLLKKDDILFTMTGTKGKRDYFYTAKVPSIKKNLLLNQRVGCLRCFSSEINIDFLCLVLKGEYVLDAIFSTETGNVSQGNIGSESTLNLNIAIPPLTEQHRIVVEIEKWFALIDQIEQGKSDLQSTIKQTKSKILDLAIHGKLVSQDPNDEPASELLKRINPNFTPCDNGHYPAGWQQTILGELFNHNTGKALNSVNRDGVMKDYLTTSNVYWNKFDFTVIKQMSFKESELDKCTVTKGDLLVCEGGDIGRSAIWNYDYDICIQNHIHRLRPKIDLCVPFYYYTLAYLKENNLIGGKGIGLLGLSSNALHKIEIPLPPLAEQQRIVQKIKKLFSVLDNIQKALEV